jgi:hypothetical protein
MMLRIVDGKITMKMGIITTKAPKVGSRAASTRGTVSASLSCPSLWHFFGGGARRRSVHEGSDPPSTSARFLFVHANDCWSGSGDCLGVSASE